MFQLKTAAPSGLSDEPSGQSFPWVRSFAALAAFRQEQNPLETPRFWRLERTTHTPRRQAARKTYGREKAAQDGEAAGTPTPHSFYQNHSLDYRNNYAISIIVQQLNYFTIIYGRTSWKLSSTKRDLSRFRDTHNRPAAGVFDLAWQRGGRIPGKARLSALSTSPGDWNAAFPDRSVGTPEKRVYHIYHRHAGLYGKLPPRICNGEEILASLIQMLPNLPTAGTTQKKSSRICRNRNRQIAFSRPFSAFPRGRRAHPPAPGRALRACAVSGLAGGLYPLQCESPFRRAKQYITAHLMNRPERLGDALGTGKQCLSPGKNSMAVRQAKIRNARLIKPDSFWNERIYRFVHLQNRRLVYRI